VRLRSLIMMIFRAASSWDIGWGAYRATATGLDWMRREAQGLFAQRRANFAKGRIFRLTSYPNALLFG
jgi:hypothetical protein